MAWLFWLWASCPAGCRGSDQGIWGSIQFVFVCLAAWWIMRVQFFGVAVGAVVELPGSDSVGFGDSSHGGVIGIKDELRQFWSLRALTWGHNRWSEAL